MRGKRNRVKGKSVDTKSNFYYKVRNDYGQVIEGHIERDNKRQRIQILKNQGKLIDLKEKKSLFGKSQFTSNYNLNVNQRVEFFEEFLIRKEIGIPNISILDNMKNNDTLNIKVRNLRSYLLQDLDKGMLLSEALAKRKIPKFICEIVKTGETTGKLEKRFETIIQVDKMKEDVSSTMKSIFMMPSIMMVLATFAYYMIGKKLMPTFEKNFLGINPDFNRLPENVQSVFNIYHNIEWYIGGTYFVIITSIMTFYLLYTRVDSFKMYISQKLLKFPLINKFILLKDLTIITKMIGLSLDSGCDYKTSRKNSYEQISNSYTKKQMSQVIHGVSNGLNLRERMSFVKMDGNLVTILKQGQQRGKEKTVELLDRLSVGYIKKIYININKLKEIKSLLQTLITMSMFMPLVYSILTPQTELMLFAMRSRRR